MKIIRISTVGESLNLFCRGLLRELSDDGYDVVAISSPDSHLKELSQRENVKSIAVRMERHMAPFKDLRSLWGLIKAFRKEKPDMVHSITPKAGLLSMMAAWICRVPVRLHTFTGLVFPTASGLTQKILMMTDRLTCACATHIVPEGEGIKNDLINYKITKKTLKVLGYGNIRGIDLEYYDPELPEVRTHATRIKKDGFFTFIFIGRMVRDKGINELIEAFEKFNTLYPKSRLLLVGTFEPELDPLLPETMHKINDNPYIESVGRQNDVRPWLLVSDVLVFPSYREGFPNVVIEAGAMGLPAIVTDINGSREIIIEGKNGTIVPSMNSKPLLDAMERLYTDRVKCKEMAANARQMIASRYEQGFVRRCLKEYYSEILDGVK